MSRSVLFKKEIEINPKISVVVPTVGDILDNEESYYSVVNLITSMPIDMMVFLDKIGIDFTEIDEYELFLILFGTLVDMDTHLVFGDLDLKKFKRAVNQQNGEFVMVDTENDIVIDRCIHGLIADTLRKINRIEKNNKKPGNKEAKEYMLERAKAKANRRAGKHIESQLEPIIIALVNTEQFKYNFETVENITIYQFYTSMVQIANKVNYDNRMLGVYTGNIDIKELSQDELSWIYHK